MKNRKINQTMFMALIIALFSHTLSANHIWDSNDEDLVHVTGKYVNLSSSQLMNVALKAYNGTDLPKGHNGHKPDFLYHKTRHYRVTVNSIKTNRVPLAAGPELVSNTGQKTQRVKHIKEGDELEIMGLITVQPLSNKQDYRIQNGANDILFSRDLRGDKLLVVPLNQKTRINKTRDFYIRNKKAKNAGFRLKFALLEYDKVGTKEEPFTAAHYDVKVGNYDWNRGTTKTFTKQLSNTTNDQVITVFFTVELVKKISDREMLDMVCTRNVGQTERLIRKGGNPNAKHLFAYSAQNKDERMMDMLMEYGAKPTAEDLKEFMSKSHYSREGVRLLVQRGAVADEHALNRAIQSRDTELVRYFLRNNACPTSNNLYEAFKNDQRQIAFLLIDYGAPASEKILEMAVHRGDVDLANLIMSKGIRPNSDMVIECVRDQNFEMTRCLVSKVKPDHRAILEACRVNDFRLFSLLINHGGWLKNNEPIHRAIDYNNYDIIELGLRNGGRVNEAMEYAAKRHDRNMVLFLLDRGANPNLALPYAIRTSDVQFFDDLMFRYNANADDAFAESLKANNEIFIQKVLETNRINPNLHIAKVAEMGDLELIQTLVEKGGDPNKGIQKAISNNRLKVVEYLLWEGASPNGFIAEAAKKGHQDMVFLLLEYGANPDDAMKSAVQYDQTAVVQMLLNYGAETKGQLANPAGEGNLELVQLLLDGGANPNEGMRNAVRNNRFEVVQTLLNHGARANDFLEIPVSKNRQEMVRLLLEFDANPNEGMSMAVQKGFNDLVVDLLKYGADGTKIEYLKTAVEKKNANLVTMLHDAGANVNYTYPDGKTLLHVATFMAYNYPTVRSLIDAGARINMTDKRDNTPLHLAVAIGKENMNVIQLLVENHADVNAINYNKESIHKRAKHGKVKRYLRKNGAKRKGIV